MISLITMHSHRGTALTGWGKGGINITNHHAHPPGHRPYGMGGGGEHRCLKLLAHPPYERCPRTHGAPEGAQGCFLVGNN